MYGRYALPDLYAGHPTRPSSESSQQFVYTSIYCTMSRSLVLDLQRTTTSPRLAFRDPTTRETRRSSTTADETARRAS